MRTRPREEIEKELYVLQELQKTTETLSRLWYKYEGLINALQWTLEPGFRTEIWLR